MKTRAKKRAEISLRDRLSDEQLQQQRKKSHRADANELDGYLTDLARLRACVQGTAHHNASDVDLTCAWFNYSESLCAAWLELPPDDQNLLIILRGHFPPSVQADRGQIGTTWDFRVLEFADTDGTLFHEIRDVYYNADGQLDGIGDRAAGVGAGDIAGLGWLLDRMREAIDKPVIRQSDVSHPIENAV
jgi:hypothetical protein